jgi:hypothetical protein
MAVDLIQFLEMHLPQGFEPQPYYSHDEDALTFYFDNAESYARRLSELFTLFLSLKTDNPVGCHVNGVRKNLKRLGDFGLTIKQGKLRLGLFFHLLAFLAEKPEQQISYLDLSRRTRDVDVELDEELVGV